uniref:Helitron helicase-like domain-containing protein n=1 Tax=Amphimedon queenslandica TaxID=400682 RepID=A0A1X7U2H6_AMPQE
MCYMKNLKAIYVLCWLQILGANQYWFSVKGEVKAMIAENGSPTLFLTLSCAEYNSADTVQYFRQDFFDMVILQRGVLGKVQQYYVEQIIKCMECLIINSSYGLKMLLLSVSFVQKKSVLSYKIELPVIHKITNMTVFASM